MELLTVTGLSVTIHDTEIISGVSCSVNQGDYLNIIGPNGAGKTTLLKTLTALLPPSRGEIILKGSDIRTYSDTALARSIAFVPQHTAVKNYQSFTVFEYMLTGRFPYLNRLTGYTAGDRKIVCGIMEQLALTRFRDRRLSTLSGGELQKVILGAALAQQADIILLDEATTFLDIRHKLEFYNYLDLLVQQGETIISVTHNLNDIVNTTGNVLALKNGAQMFFGSMADCIRDNIVENVFGVSFKKIEDPENNIFHYIPVALLNEN